MRRSQFGLLLVVTAISGLIGGTLVNRFFPPPVLRAARFEAVDKRGEVRASLDKSGLVFFPREGTIAPVVLHADGFLRFNTGGRLELSAMSLRFSDVEGKILWETPVREHASPIDVAHESLPVTTPPETPSRTSPLVQDQPPSPTPTGAPMSRKRVPHPACPHCFTYDCPECYSVLEEVPGTGVIISRQIPNPAPGRPQGIEFDKRGRPLWYVGNQPIMGPTDEEPVSRDLPIPLIEVKRIQARHQQEIMSIPGVHGFGIGAKGFVVFVLPEKQDVMPQIPKVLEGIPVEVEVRGTAVFLGSDLAK